MPMKFSILNEAKEACILDVNCGGIFQACTASGIDTDYELCSRSSGYLTSDCGATAYQKSDFDEYNQCIILDSISFELNTLRNG